MSTEVASNGSGVGVSVGERGGLAWLHDNPPMWSRWLSWGVWGLVSASVVYWGVRLFAPSQETPAQAAVAVPKGIARGDLTRVFGPDEAPKPDAEALPAPDKRFALLGVVAPRARAGSQAAREGIAVIAIEGKPAKAYRVGAVVDGDTVVQTVAPRSVTLGPKGGPALVSLELAAPPAAATASGVGLSVGNVGAAATPAAVATTQPPAPAASVAGRTPRVLRGAQSE